MKSARRRLEYDIFVIVDPARRSRKISRDPTPEHPHQKKGRRLYVLRLK